MISPLIQPARSDASSTTAEAMSSGRPSLPETIVIALPGRRVSDFAQLPFRCDCFATSAEPLNGGGVRLSLDVQESLIDLSSGRIWRAPGVTA